MRPEADDNSGCIRIRVDNAGYIRIVAPYFLVQLQGHLNVSFLLARHMVDDLRRIT